eukprot:TRINITY_DN2121_c0_g1_i1.p1 TRINITY_DN2121_c0_g1~~TRINITY_DN2121_c0_g1_i1.p1  ORF type:complete len:216 (-),score=46.25 TRINITY_DN2121_c0_g1_i1:596-1243(-)
MSEKKIVILGGGVIGSSIAYHLTLKKAKPIVVERCKVAAAASGKAGGFLAMDWCDSGPSKQLARLSFKMHEDMSNGVASNCGYRKLDTLAIDVNAKSNGDDDYPSLPGWVSPRHVQSCQVIGTQKNTAQVHPELFTNALMNTALANGAQLKIACAKSIILSSDQKKVVGVELDDGTKLEADVVVVALGPWCDTLNFKKLPSITGRKAHRFLLLTK